MRLRTLALLMGVIFLFATTVASQTSSEDEFINNYLKKIEKKHTSRLTWISGYFSFNRINRDNDYNRFANLESVNFTDASVSWLGDAKVLGVDFGLLFGKRFGWTLSGEYWLKMGETLEGTYYYEPAGTYLENPASEIQVFGASTGIQYYLMNPPKVGASAKDLSVRVGAAVGYYQVKWDLWDEYQDLNLATNTTDASSATFQDSGPGFFMNVGIDYPTKVWNLVLGVDMCLQYLEFDNVAWYNSSEQEVVASWSGDSDGRVDLEFTGLRGKVELKHFFSW